MPIWLGALYRQLISGVAASVAFARPFSECHTPSAPASVVAPAPQDAPVTLLPATPLPQFSDGLVGSKL